MCASAWRMFVGHLCDETILSQENVSTVESSAA
jgi:hypothetical protein